VSGERPGRPLDVAASAAATPPRALRTRPLRSWAEILQRRPAKSGSGLLFAASVVLMACLAMGALVWTNRHALDAAPAGSSPSGEGTTASSAAATAPTLAPSAEAPAATPSRRSGSPRPTGTPAPRKSTLPSRDN
jgi:hypothetical protein